VRQSTLTTRRARRGVLHPRHLARPLGDAQLSLQTQAGRFALDLALLLGREGSDFSQSGHGLLEQLESLARQFTGQMAEPGDVPPGRMASNELADALSTFCPTRSLAAFSISSPSRTAQRGMRT
jgi:hypothetical protein